MATPIASPQNIIAAGYLSKLPPDQQVMMEMVMEMEMVMVMVMVMVRFAL